MRREKRKAFDLVGREDLVVVVDLDFVLVCVANLCDSLAAW
jgi:hypothetical protein